MSTLIAASIIPAYGDIAEDLGVSLHQATYLTSLQIAILGVGPLLWMPLARRFGCRPIFLVSTICSLAGNIGCAKSPSYSSMAACRAITAFFICPAAALGSEVVAKTFFKKERARYMGIWTVMITVGVPLGPLVFGFVAHRIGCRWIYWVLAMVRHIFFSLVRIYTILTLEQVNAAQFILYIFFGPETIYVRNSVNYSRSSFKAEYLTFRRIDSKSFTLREFFEPLSMVRHASVVIPSAAYAMIFLFGSILVTVEIPELFQEKFNFTPEQLGLQFIGVIVGSLLGEQLGGSLSDYWMARRARQISKSPSPEFRLWLSYIGFLLTIVGVVVFLVRTEQAPHGHWNITPIIGVAIAAFGNQVVTTVSITYAVDCHHHQAASVGVFITLVRQIWGFIGPFWYISHSFRSRYLPLTNAYRFPAMFKSVGVAASAGVVAALVVGVCIIPTVFLHWNR